MDNPSAESILARVRFDNAEGTFFSKEGEKLDFTFDPRTGVFVTTTGTRFTLRRVSAQTLHRIGVAYDKKHRPVMPKKAIEYGENEFYLEGNPNDPAYQDAIEAYNSQANLFALEVQYSLSVRETMPDIDDWPVAFYEEYQLGVELEGEPDKHKLRYWWILHHLPSDDESLVFMQLVNGREIPTVEAIEEAEERFPDHDQQA